MSLTGQRVLLVEDDALIGEAWALLLSAQHAIVLGPYTTAAEALRAVKAEVPDLAVLDYHLHVGTSLPVANMLITLGVPTVIVSSAHQDDLPTELRGLPFVPKPTTGREFLSAIAALRE